MPSRNEPGLPKNASYICQGGNSGYQAMNVAYLLGVKRIILLGFDMQRTAGKAHWFGDHPRGLQVPSPYKTWIEKFEALSLDLYGRGVEVFNCSRETAIPWFMRAPLKEAL